MANPFHHAVSSTRKWGGIVEDYIEIHTWFDLSKEHLADFRHRALRHHTHGIFEAERVFGHTITLTTCARCGLVDTSAMHSDVPGLAERHEFVEKKIPVRWIGEQHVQEDLGFIPTAAQWLERIQAEPWMNKSRRLSVELATTERSDAP